jgi:hypothetical protein
MIEDLYRSQATLIHTRQEVNPLNLELLASFERLLCYCHTGNTAVLATSLMRPLGLSRGALVDGFPMLLNPFQHPEIYLASQHGFQISTKRWPLKAGFPAVASKKAQVLTYSINHFLVRLFQALSFYFPSFFSSLSLHHLLSYLRHTRQSSVFLIHL